MENHPYRPTITSRNSYVSQNYSYDESRRSFYEPLRSAQSFREKHPLRSTIGSYHPHESFEVQMLKGLKSKYAQRITMDAINRSSSNQNESSYSHDFRQFNLDHHKQNSLNLGDYNEAKELLKQLRTERYEKEKGLIPDRR